MLNVIVKGSVFGNQSARNHVLGNNAYTIWTIALNGNITVKKVNQNEEDIKNLKLVNLVDEKVLFEDRFNYNSKYEHYLQFLK
jgi:hypothetical protein